MLLFLYEKILSKVDKKCHWKLNVFLLNSHFTWELILIIIVTANCMIRRLNIDSDKTLSFTSS